MAVTANLYGSYPAKAANKEVNWLSDTIKVALLTSAYTPNQDVHAYFSDLTNETTGTGYTAGGATLASKTVSYNATTNTQTFTAAATTWTGSTLTARYAVIYGSTGTASTSPLIAYVNFGADVATTGATFTITWDTAGIYTVTVA